MAKNGHFKAKNGHFKAFLHGILINRTFFSLKSIIIVTVNYSCDNCLGLSLNRVFLKISSETDKDLTSGI